MIDVFIGWFMLVFLMCVAAAFSYVVFVVVPRNKRWYAKRGQKKGSVGL